MVVVVVGIQKEMGEEAGEWLYDECLPFLVDEHAYKNEQTADNGVGEPGADQILEGAGQGYSGKNNGDQCDDEYDAAQNQCGQQ